MPPRSQPRATDTAPIGALAGFAVAMVSDLRRHPVAEELAGMGARVVGVQAIRAISQPAEQDLRQATMDCLTSPVDHVVATESVGFNQWMAAARSWRLDVPLLARFAHARLLASDPRSTRALRELGFTEIWSAADGATEGLIAHLCHTLPPGEVVALQTHLPPMTEYVHTLGGVGARVVAVPTFQVLPSASPESMRRLVTQIVRRNLDAIVLTSPEAVRGLLWHARTCDQFDELRRALRSDIVAVCLGPLTAAPLLALDIPARAAASPFNGHLTWAVRQALLERAHHVGAASHTLEIRSEAVLVDGRLLPVQQGPLAVLKVLAGNRHRVLPPAEIRTHLPTWVTVDDHAVEMAVSRLRQALGADLVETVMKRGYRLVDHLPGVADGGQPGPLG